MEKVLNALFVCHRLPERSFFYRGRQFPICARCTGILVGYFIGIIYAFIFGKIPVSIIFILLTPLIIDGGFQYMGKWTSTNTRRFVTGILAGVGTDYLIYELLANGYRHGRQIMHYIIDVL